MKRTLVCVFLTSSLLPLAHGAGYDSDQSPRTKPFVDGMLNMMDRMGFIDLDDYPDRTGSDHNWASAPSWQSFDGYSPSSLYPPAGMSRIPVPTQPRQPRSPSSPLNGIWKGRSGEILMIRDGGFRIYATRDRYRQGKLRIRGKTLFMHDPRTNTTNAYEFATEKGRMALRDAEGRLLLYRRLKNR